MFFRLPTRRPRAPLMVFVTVALLVWVACLALGPRGVVVHVRWRAGLAESDRSVLETRFHLTRPEFVEGTTWRYLLADPSRSVIRALVRDEAVEDTARLHRTQFRPERAQDHRFWFAIYSVGAGLFATTIAWVIQRLPRRARRDATASAPPSPRFWTMLALAATVPTLLALTTTIWRTPFPVTETVSILEDTLGASSVTRHLDPSLRSWYRPLYFVTWHALLASTDSIDVALTMFRVLEIVPIVLLVCLMVAWLRPSTLAQAGAALCAVAVLVGAPAFRDNIELPLLYTLVALPLVLITWRLLESKARSWHGGVFVVLAVIAVGFKEQGLVLVALVILGPFMRAPGASRRGAIVLAVVTAGYLVLRMTSAGQLHRFEGDIAIGFTEWSAAEANARFQDDFIWVYVYNALAVVGNLLLSEPSRGHFQIIESASRGIVLPSDVVTVLTSAGLSGLIGWWACVVVRRDRAWTTATRLVALVAVTAVASGVLAFSYPRDRHAAMPLVLYSVAAYHALCLALERAGQSLAWRRVGMTMLLGVLAAGWQVRQVGTVYYAQERSVASQVDWIADPAVVRAEMGDRATYMKVFNMLARQGLNEDIAQPPRYPRWFDLLLRREAP